MSSDEPKARRAAPLTFRPTEKEAAIIRANAESSGKNFNRYVCETLTGTQVRGGILSQAELDLTAQIIARLGPTTDALKALNAPGGDEVAKQVAEIHDMAVDITAIVLRLHRKRGG